MPTLLAEFGRRHTGRRPIYDWDLWLDGRPRRFERYQDFTCEIDSFRTAAICAARTRGVRIITQRPRSNCIVIQAVR